jgi:hypothetical protein
MNEVCSRLVALWSLLRELEGELCLYDPFSGLRVEVRLEGGRVSARCWIDDDDDDHEGTDDARW